MKLNDIQVLKERPLLSPKEYGLLVGFSDQIIRDYCRRGLIPHRKIGGRIRIPQSAWKEAMDS